MEGAMVAIDPMTGAVRALVGGRDYYESNFNRSTQVQIPLFILFVVGYSSSSFP
jgi:membrane carboxypeptidase/penicillin-binding protein